MAVDIIQISSVYDSLETKIKATLNEQWNSGRLTGSDYAQVLSQTLNNLMALSVRTVQNQPILDEQIKKLQEDNLLATDTHNFKVDLSKNQADKVLADKQLVDEQKNGITQQVVDNRKIKALNSLANTYGVFGSGGLTLSTDMWTTYFNIVSDLTGETAPNNTTVAKVT